VGSLFRVGGIVLVALGLVATNASSAAAPAFTDPIPLGFPGGDDWEPAIAADRFGHVYALWTHFGPDPACPGCASPHVELQISADGGSTWSAPRPLAPTNERQDDPQIEVDPVDGQTVYAAHMQGDRSSQIVARSTDFGQTWVSSVVETFTLGTDKDILAVRGQDVYLGFHRGAKVYVSGSHDAGKTWSVARVIDRATQERFGASLASGAAVDTHGNVYFAWNGVSHGRRSLGPVYLYLTKSIDGGATWASQQIAKSQGGPPCGCPGWDYWGPQMAVATDHADSVYLLWNQDRVDFAPQKLLFASSSDGGRTWLRRNDVSLAPRGTNHLFPALVARGEGDVRAGWMDDRNGFDGGRDDPNARWNTYERSSTDGGKTWAPEAQMSRFVPGYPYKLREPQDGFLEPYGDYFELAIGRRGRTQAIWGEGPSYAGPGNVWYARGR
jgi:BNR repeat protein